jgi:cytochrome P450
MREIINDLIGLFAPAGRCEFVADFADQYPPQVMFDLLGVPADEHARFLRWGKDIAFLLSYGMAARRDQVDAAVAGICDATDRLCAQRRDDPGDDLLSALVAARDGDDRLTQEEIGAMVNILVLAGQDSTRCQLGMAMRLFAEHPEQWALLAERPELAPAAVEEVMRVAPVVPFVWRVADVDFDHHDLHLAAGTRIWLSVGHAQQVGADGAPDPFDITAEHRPQLTFGHGAHYCLGAQLARVEMAEALPILARRLPGLALDGEGDWRPDLAGFVGPDRLPIRFTPTAA